MNELINLEEYKKDYEIYTTALEKLPDAAQETPPDFTTLKSILSADFKSIYNTLTREEKRTLWRSVIEEIRIDNDGNITGITLGSVVLI